MTRTLAICIALLALTSTIQQTPSGKAQEPPEPELHLTTFADGNTSANHTFTEGGGNATTYVEISNHAVIHEATVNLTISPTVDGTSAPWNPSFDAGGGGTVDWSFNSERANTCGRQDQFLHGGYDWEEVMDPGYPYSDRTVLPRTTAPLADMVQSHPRERVGDGIRPRDDGVRRVPLLRLGQL
jgi:hypothetical protein